MYIPVSYTHLDVYKRQVYCIHRICCCKPYLLTIKNVRTLGGIICDRNPKAIVKYKTQSPYVFLLNKLLYFSTRKININSCTIMIGYSIYERRA